MESTEKILTPEEKEKIRKETHERFVEVWKESEFGIKTRVFETHKQQTIEYILKRDKYSNVDKMNEIIECVLTESKAVLEEVNEMVKKIEKRAS